MHANHAIALCGMLGIAAGCGTPPREVQQTRAAADGNPGENPGENPGRARPKTRRIGRMDPSRAFYYPGFAAAPGEVLGLLDGQALRADQYLRYVAGRFGTRFLEDLAFELALEQECRRLRLANSAPVLARSLAAQRFHESGRERITDADGTMQRKFLNETLRQMRIDALVGLRRSEDDAAVRGLFERRYGVGGARVRIRQILVSFAGSRRRLPGNPSEEEIRAATRNRAAKLRAQIAEGAPFDSLLGKSDDRATRAMLRRPDQRAEAGVLAGYNYQRYGEEFAAAVRSLPVGNVSAPVQTRVGYHLIEMVARTVTRLDQVEANLRRELRRGPAKPAEIARLRVELLESYGFHPGPKRDVR